MMYGICTINKRIVNVLLKTCQTRQISGLHGRPILGHFLKIRLVETKYFINGQRTLRTGTGLRDDRGRQSTYYISADPNQVLNKEPSIIRRLRGRIGSKSEVLTFRRSLRSFRSANYAANGGRHRSWFRGWNGRVLACGHHCDPSPLYHLQGDPNVPRNSIDVNTVKACSNFNKTKQAWRETRMKVKERIEEIGLKENILTVPNALCVTRILLTPVLGYLVMTNVYGHALILFCCAGVTDLLDGYIARNFNQQSMLGSFLDPMADKFLVATLFVTLTAVDLIPVPLTALIIVRDACLMSAGFYIRYKSLPPPRTITRYFDASFATAKLSPTPISKANTAIQLCLVGGTLTAAVFDFTNHPILHAFWYLTAGTTILSGFSYLVSKNTYKILRKSAQSKKH